MFSGRMRGNSGSSQQMVRAAPKDDGEALKPLVFGLALLVAFGIATNAYAHVFWDKLYPQELDELKELEPGGRFRAPGGTSYMKPDVMLILNHTIKPQVDAERTMRAWSPAQAQGWDDQFWDQRLSARVAAQEITALWKDPSPYHSENVLGNSITYRFLDGDKQHFQYVLLGVGDEVHMFTVRGSLEAALEYKEELDDQLASLMRMADRAHRFR
ncbi:MAG: hypothetical protein O7E52_10925 [Candidatus Poribacteria bacterium]|nr:hypothetical protein [Candidatus Poribacteria bacterium]